MAATDTIEIVILVPSVAADVPASPGYQTSETFRQHAQAKTHASLGSTMTRLRSMAGAWRGK